MDDYDFEVEVYCSVKKAIIIKKKEAIRVDGNNYIICFNTDDIGAGDLKLKITAHIPDSDFNDGLRTEVLGLDTGINIVKTI